MWYLQLLSAKEKKRTHTLFADVDPTLLVSPLPKNKKNKNKRIRYNFNSLNNWTGNIFLTHTGWPIRTIPHLCPNQILVFDRFFFNFHFSAANFGIPNSEFTRSHNEMAIWYNDNRLLLSDFPLAGTLNLALSLSDVSDVI